MGLESWRPAPAAWPGCPWQSWELGQQTCLGSMYEQQPWGARGGMQEGVSREECGVVAFVTSHC